jgi:hypothetical protein
VVDYNSDFISRDDNIMQHCRNYEHEASSSALQSTIYNTCTALKCHTSRLRVVVTETSTSHTLVCDDNRRSRVSLISSSEGARNVGNLLLSRRKSRTGCSMTIQTFFLDDDYDDDSNNRLTRAVIASLCTTQLYQLVRTLNKNHLARNTNSSVVDC